MNAKNEVNKNVDWWFMYKTPEDTGSQNNKGYQYLYFDTDSDKLTLSKNTLDKKEGALYYTLENSLNSNNKKQGFIIYNDEKPIVGSNNDSKGHCKGILVFNKVEDTAMILLHSVPRFPVKGAYTLPIREKRYGQTFLCITLENYATANSIAEQILQQQNAQVIVADSYLPANITESEPIYHFFHQTNINESKTPSTIHFKSKGGMEFQLIAKSKKWGKDFWIDLVGATLDISLDVETWREGRGGPEPASIKTNDPEEIEDVITVDLSKIGYSKYQWEYTKDHSKWAVADKANSDKDAWVCVGDINRWISQEKRGGGSICFREPHLWEALRSIVPVLKEEK